MTTPTNPSWLFRLFPTRGAAKSCSVEMKVVRSPIRDHQFIRSVGLLCHGRPWAMVHACMATDANNIQHRRRRRRRGFPSEQSGGKSRAEKVIWAGKPAGGGSAKARGAKGIWRESLGGKPRCCGAVETRNDTITIGSTPNDYDQ